MSVADTSAPRRFRPRLARIPATAWAIGGSVSAYLALSGLILVNAEAVPRFKFDPSPMIEAGTAVHIHVAAALMTLGIGVFLLMAPKGFTLHRTFGWLWVVSMAFTAGSSFFITAIFQSHFSPIHALSAWVMLGLPMGIAAIRRRDVARHRKAMTDMFTGGMVIAGLFSLLPGRLIWHVFFSV